MPVTFDPRSASPTTVDADVCIAGPDRISLFEEPITVEGDAAGLSDAGTVLSETPVSVETAELTAPARRLLVRSVVLVTTLDCALGEPFAVGKRLHHCYSCYSPIYTLY